MNPPVNPMFAKFDQALGKTSPTVNSAGAPNKSRADEIRSIAVQNTPKTPDTFMGATLTDTGSRAKQDIQNTGSNISSALSGTGDYAGQSTIRRATSAVSEASSLPLKVASEALPDSVRSGISKVGSAAGGVINWLGDKIGDSKALQNWTLAHPEAAKNLEEIAGTAANMGNIAGNILATEGIKTGVPKAVNAVSDATTSIAGKIGETAGKLNPIGEKAASLSDATDIVSPKMTAKETAQALAEGRGSGGGLLSKTKIAPDAMTNKIAEATQGIVKKGVPASKNIANLRQALSSEAENLKSQIKDVNHPYSFKELNAKLKGVESPISIKGTAFEKQIGAVKQAAMDIAKKSGGKISNLLDARKGFDALVSKEYPNLYDSTSAPMKNAITSIRNAMNDFIDENLPDNTSFKNSLNKQSMYYRAIDNIAEKAVGETKTTGIGRIGKALKSHPLVSGAIGIEGAKKVITGHF